MQHMKVTVILKDREKTFVYNLQVVEHTFYFIFTFKVTHSRWLIPARSPQSEKYH